MGLRGPGAGRARAAREAVEAEPRDLPWKVEGLSRVDRVIAFLEFLPITKGPLAGKRMELLPAQIEFVTEIYGNLTPEGLRRRRIGIKSEPKGNGKTGLVAGLVLCHLIGPEAEQRGEVYSGAIDRGQAALIFAECEAMIVRVPEFLARCNIVRHFKKIEVLSGDGEGSIYEAMSADARRAHGIAPSLFVYDELAQAKDRELLDNLINGLGKRLEALGLIISTQAPNDEHALSQMIDDGLSGADDSIFVQLIAAPPDANIFDEQTWFDCNPALGKYLSVEEMRQAAERARRIPAFEPAFRNLRLNQRVETAMDARLCVADVWKRGARAKVDIPELDGRECYAALDLSGKHDLTSLTLVFPGDEPEAPFDVLPMFWTPMGAMAARRPSEQEHFSRWIRDGYIEPIEGPVIRSRRIAEHLVELRHRYKIKAVAYDRWRIDDLKQDLAELGYAGDEDWLQPFGQGFKDMAPAIEFFSECALTDRINHGGNPVLSACVANAILQTDPAGNQKIDKGRSNSRGTTRIDGAVTLVMALGLAKRFVTQAAPPRTFQMLIV